MGGQRGYKIDGTDLNVTYGIRVLRVKGAYDFLARKGETSYSWPDSDGVEAFTDATDIYYDTRNIFLFCAMVAESQSEFRTKMNNFKYMLETSGTHTLTLPYDSSRTITFFYEGGDTVEVPKWNGSKVFARFRLKLIEKTPDRASAP